jgi:hypothetical protein
MYAAKPFDRAEHSSLGFTTKQTKIALLIYILIKKL